ncbi:hypothetical protein [Kitasatospora sp. McL0602]|uniref:hypothetical protein n=1 Tax=Kitasatospora sp. McL0602 TaxID=3439530 RepID=UPI003F8C38F6
MTTSRRPKVSWYAQYVCHTCRDGGDGGDGGDALFEDGTIVDADHDCDQGEAEIAWEGRAECATCGWSLETDFADGDYVEADHHCHADQ